MSCISVVGCRIVTLYEQEGAGIEDAVVLPISSEELLDVFVNDVAYGEINIKHIRQGCLVLSLIGYLEDLAWFIFKLIILTI